MANDFCCFCLWNLFIESIHITHAAQRLLSSAGGKALEKLGESVAFELVVGLNGRCWIDAASAEDQIVVARTLAGGGALY